MGTAKVVSGEVSSSEGQRERGRDRATDVRAWTDTAERRTRGDSARQGGERGRWTGSGSGERGEAGQDCDWSLHQVPAAACATQA